MSARPALSKTDFGEIYDQPDPRPYFARLAPLDYTIPGQGSAVFEQLLQARQDLSLSSGTRPSVLDMCCSYGLVAILLRTDLDMDGLTAHYSDAGTADLGPEQFAALDRQFLAEHRLPDAPEVIGLDVAKNAVAYAVSVGAMDDGAAENLEEDDPSPELAQKLANLDLITTTGGVGYITEKTFDRVLEVAEPTAWVASFNLRTYDYAPITTHLAERGLQTEKLETTFSQRQFASDEERRWATEQVRAHGHDPSGKEDEGSFHAECYLSRPQEHVAELPLAELLSES